SASWSNASPRPKPGPSSTSSSPASTTTRPCTGTSSARRCTEHHFFGMPRCPASRRAFALGDEPGEFLHHALVDVALERHDEVRQLAHLNPAPVDELRRVMAAGGQRDVDFAVLAGEAQRVPFLLLAAVFAAPGFVRNL